ncbi:MAG: primosomal protein [Pseudomonadota bacterium]|jgi:primosomal protein N' (replication factor Y)
MSFTEKNKKQSIVQVAIDTPVNKLFDYIWDHSSLEAEPQRGQIVSIEFGRKELVGVVIKEIKSTNFDIQKLKHVTGIAPCAPISEDVIGMAEFASVYYQKSIGEVLVPAIPKYWRQKEKWPLLSKAKRKTKSAEKKNHQNNEEQKAIELNNEQVTVIEQLVKASQKNKFETFLLQGVTGSGKTLTYLRWLSKVLEEENSQVLIMVPEINLTPQLEESVRIAFPESSLVVMHSGLTDRTRADNWMKANAGEAQIILGTRMAVMTSMPNLRAIVVDEEHDLSYKQQEGVRYSARDLAVWRAKKMEVPILLVSATPSLETWFHAEDKKYKKLSLNNRAAKNARKPIIDIVDLNIDRQSGNKNEHGFSAHLLNGIAKNLELGLQTLIYINRRGYSPVLNCEACSWVSDCLKCSAHMVLHRPAGERASLCCHHCGLIRSIPKVCPSCGNTDLIPLGKGTQKVEEFLSQQFPQAKILRIDADTTRKKGSAEELFGSIHDGDADIIVGTQMVTKGHDYQSVALVGVIDADASLFSQDYRAAERLFAQLMQVTGRAGRSEKSGASRVVIQTRYPSAAPYKYLQQDDVNGFLSEVCEERKMVGLPPFSYQALIHAEHKTLIAAIDMLKEASSSAQLSESWPQNVMMSDVVPKTMVRLAGKERAQILMECVNRQSLQCALEIFQQALAEQNTKRKGVGWYIERDPVQI